MLKSEHAATNNTRHQSSNWTTHLLTASLVDDSGTCSQALASNCRLLPTKTLTCLHCCRLLTILQRHVCTIWKGEFLWLFQPCTHEFSCVCLRKLGKHITTTSFPDFMTARTALLNFPGKPFEA